MRLPKPASRQRLRRVDLWQEPQGHERGKVQHRAQKGIGLPRLVCLGTDEAGSRGRGRQALGSPRLRHVDGKGVLLVHELQQHPVSVHDERQVENVLADALDARRVQACVR